MRQTKVWTNWAAPREAASKHLRFALFGATAALMAACSAPAADPISTIQQAASTPFANDQTAYDYFAAKGLTNFQAAAIVGNLDQESGIDPTISQSGGGVGRGIAQWSTGGRWDTTQNDNVLAYAAAHGQSATSLTLQLDFVWYELTTFPDYGLAKLKATSNVTDATGVVEDNYEGCVYANYPECALPTRIMYAMGVLNAYGSDPVQGGAGAGGSGGASSGGAAGFGGSGGSSSGGAGAGGSGGAAAGSGGSSGSSGGSSSGVGGSSAGGAGAGGSEVSVAGHSSSAGGSSTAPASASESSSCALSRAIASHSASDGSFRFCAALLVLGLTLRIRRRKRA